MRHGDRREKAGKRSGVKKKARWEEMSMEEHMELYLGQGMDKKSAMKQVAKDRGVGKRDVYQALLQTP